MNYCKVVILLCYRQETKGLLDAKDDIILLLKQASCFGNHDATFMLSVILNYGLDIKPNELQVISTVLKINHIRNLFCIIGVCNGAVSSSHLLHLVGGERRVFLC